MDLSDWIVGLYCLGCGTGLVIFWSARLSAKRVATDQYVMRLHLVAEFVTAAFLLGGGVSTFVRPRAPGTLVTVGVGLGLLVYAAAQSPAFYPDEKLIRGQLWVTLVLTVAMFALRVATL